MRTDRVRATLRPPRLRDDPATLCVDAPVVMAAVGGRVRVRPDIAWRLFVEHTPVARQRVAVPAMELVALRCAAGGWMVMERHAERVAAQPVPVRLRVEEVQVP